MENSITFALPSIGESAMKPELQKEMVAIQAASFIVSNMILGNPGYGTAAVKDLTKEIKKILMA